MENVQVRQSEFITLIQHLPESHRDTLAQLLIHLERSVTRNVLVCYATRSGVPAPRGQRGRLLPYPIVVRERTGQSAVPCCSAEQATPSYRPRPHYCHMCDSSLTSPISEPHSRGFALCETTTLQFVAYIGQQLTIPATAIYSNRSVEFRLSILTLLLGLRTPTFMALRFQPAPVALYGLRRL